MEWVEITIEFNDRPVSGSYIVENQTVIVRTALGAKSVELGIADPAWLAFRLLRELAAEGKV